MHFRTYKHWSDGDGYNETGDEMGSDMEDYDTGICRYFVYNMLSVQIITSINDLRFHSKLKSLSMIQFYREITIITDIISNPAMK